MIKESILQTLGREYRKNLSESARSFNLLKGEKPKNRNAWIGTHAEQVWLHDFRRHTGILRRSAGIDPMSAVSNTGNPRRTDALATLIAGERAQFELKKSDYGGTRLYSQLIAQIFDLGLGTHGAETLNVIYGENGRVDVYTREQGKIMVAAADKGEAVSLPSPARTIEFARDITGTEKKETRKETKSASIHHK